MTFQTFTEKVQLALQDYYGGNTEITIQRVLKNNGMEMIGAAIFRENSNVAATIYLEHFFEEYKNGVTFAETVRQIISIEENSRRKQMDVTFLFEYEQARKHLACRLVNRKENRELLETVPNRDVVGLALICHCVSVGDEYGCAGMLVNRDHLRMWEIDEETLFRDALLNMPGILPVQRFSMREFIRDSMRDMVEAKMQEMKEMGECEPEGETWEQMIDRITDILIEKREGIRKMMVLTNCHKFFGAAVLVYPGLLERLAGEFAESFYVLPSSVHEVILLSKDTGESPEYLRTLVNHVNMTHVAKEEILSNEVYFYRKGQGFLKKA